MKEGRKRKMKPLQTFLSAFPSFKIRLQSESGLRARPGRRLRCTYKVSSDKFVILPWKVRKEERSGKRKSERKKIAEEV